MASNKKYKERKMKTLNKELAYWEKEKERTTHIENEETRVKLLFAWQEFIDSIKKDIEELAKGKL